MPLSKKQVERLGSRLRHSEIPTAEDLRLLGEYRDDHLEAMATAFFAIASLPFKRMAVSARQKNANTIIEKLKKLPGMSLSRMQDIGGVRVIVRDRLDQDDAVEAIRGVLNVSRTVDRIADPHAGYRAIHLIVIVNDRSIEVQVRTALQNRWAQAYERLGDHWGRTIREDGGQPENPDSEITIGGATLTRAEIVHYMREEVSPEIADAEALERRVAGIRRRFPSLDDIPEAAATVRELEDLERFARTRVTEAEDMIRALRDLREMVPASVDADAVIHDDPGGEALHYLVGYQRRSGRLVEAHPCRNKNEVLDRRRALEEQHRGDSDFEVVLLSSQSKADLLRTHARYFEGLVDLADRPPT